MKAGSSSISPDLCCKERNVINRQINHYLDTEQTSHRGTHISGNVGLPSTNGAAYLIKSRYEVLF